VTRGRGALLVLVPPCLHAIARQVDAAVGLLLYTSLDLEHFVPEALRLVDGSALVGAVAGWCAAGVGMWLVAGRMAARSGAADARISLLCLPLLLRPAITVLALASLAFDPLYPYGFTLPIALSQDWGIAQDIAAAATIVALLIKLGGKVGDGASTGARLAVREPGLPIWAVPAPGAISIAFIAFVAYALLSPPWSHRWDSHPGNEPKTLRMAVAIGHWMSLDVEPVSAAMEALPADGPFTAIGRAARRMAVETGRMVQALAGGPDAVGRDAIRATRVTRQTIRGKEGGVFHVLAPGPSVLMAPALRVDRWLNRRAGRPGRLAVTVLWWNALAAALVAALFLLVRDATGRPGLAAAIAAASALTPPFLFYFFQFYPEMLGALVFAVALRALLFRPWWRAPEAWALGGLLATLPWLHQKFLPAWAVLASWAVIKLVGELAPLRAVLGVLIPQAVSLFLFALYNFAITGSVRPDALFLAWGPAGVSGARVGQGLLGLSLDARYGLVPYAPILLLAAGGLLMKTPLRRALPVMAVYYATVAAADNWSGAVCNLGRYFMPAAPFALALVAVVLARSAARPAVRAVALTLAGWTAVLAWLLWHDPHAANDCAQLLARSTFADGNVYVPNLFLRTWSDAAPGLGARVLAWVALAALLGWWTARAAEGRGATSPPRALAAGVATLLALAFALERWPTERRTPAFPDAVEARHGVTAFLSRNGDLVVRAREPQETLRVQASGRGVVKVSGRPPVALFDDRREIDVPLPLRSHLTGRRGVEEWLYRTRIGLEGAVTIEAVPGALSRSGGIAR